MIPPSLQTVAPNNFNLIGVDEELEDKVLLLKHISFWDQFVCLNVKKVKINNEINTNTNTCIE